MHQSSFLSRLISGLLFTAGAANAATLPVSEDTCSFPPGKIDKRSGNASTLPLSANGTAFIRFDAGDFSGLIKSTDVTSARLTFYVTEVGKAGKIGIHRVTSEWTESPAAARNAPSFDPEPLVTIPSKAVSAGQFAVVDVTAQVRKWLDEPQSDRGFAITGADGASIQIRAKEGSAAGMPASLEIDNHPVVGNKQLADGISTTKLGNGEVSNAEFAQLNGVTAPLQEQIDGIITGTNTTGLLLGALDSNLGRTQEDLATLEGDVDDLRDAGTGMGQDIDDLWDYAGDLKDGISNTDSSKVSKAGDTMTGTLNVKGNVKLGADAEFSATVGEEDLRVIRGSFRWDGVVPTLVAGGGFTWTSNANTYELTFNKPFSGIPSVVMGAGYLNTNSNTHDSVASVSATKVVFRASQSFAPGLTDVLIIGPR